MIAKIVGALLVAAGVIVGLGVLVTLIGTAIGLVWMLVKLAVPAVLLYVGYRLLVADRRPAWE